jgi:hypothetical protein
MVYKLVLVSINDNNLPSFLIPEKPMKVDCSGGVGDIQATP